LNNNSLSFLPNDIFDGLIQLETLRLDANNFPTSLNDLNENWKAIKATQLKPNFENENTKNERLANDSEIMKLRRDLESERQQYLKEIEALKHENQFLKTQAIVKKSFLNSHFKSKYSPELAPQYPDQVLLSLRQFIFSYGKLKNLNEQESTEFFDKLQKEVFDYKDDLLEKTIWI